MSELGTLIASGGGISTFIALLTLWAVWSGLGLWHASSKLHAELRKATAQIRQADTAHAFAARYEAIAQDLAGSHILGP